MDAEEARRLLALPRDEEEHIALPPSVLSQLAIDDVRDGASFQVATLKGGVVHLDWSGRFYRSGNQIWAEADYTWTRKYWYSPLGLEHYMDLVRRAVETSGKPG